MAKKVAEQIISLIKMAAKQSYKEHKQHTEAKHTKHTHSTHRTQNTGHRTHATGHHKVLYHPSAHSVKFNRLHLSAPKFIAAKQILAPGKHPTAKHTKIKTSSPKPLGIPIKFTSTSSKRTISLKPAQLFALATMSLKGSTHTFKLQPIPSDKQKTNNVPSTHATESGSSNPNIYHIARESSQRLIFPKVASEAALPSE
jgi:hypothetical protein